MTGTELLMVAAGVALLAGLIYLIHRFGDSAANGECQEQAMLAALYQGPGMGPLMWPGLFLPLRRARRPVLVTVKSRSVRAAV